MSAITSLAKAPAMPLARIFFAMTGAVTASIKQVARFYRNRKDAAVLATFDERMLADVGLTRSDVRDALGGPLWEDPTKLLRARALERRLNRHGISLGVRAPRMSAPPLVPQADWNRPATHTPARFTV